MKGRLAMALLASAIVGMSIGPTLPVPDTTIEPPSRPTSHGPPGSRSKAKRKKRKMARRMRGKK